MNLTDRLNAIKVDDAVVINSRGIAQATGTVVKITATRQFTVVSDGAALKFNRDGIEINTYHVRKRSIRPV